MVVKIIRNGQGYPEGKLADAELHFGDQEGALAGLKLVGFSIWQRRTDNQPRYVTFPARSYSVNGERRSFALLRPTGSKTVAQQGLADLILQAWTDQHATLAQQEEEARA